MKNGNAISLGGMHIDIFLSGEEQKKDTLIMPKLVHGDHIVEILSGIEEVNDCDAVLTENHTLSLGVRTADCIPICFSDGKKIGIAHVGWRGLCLGLVEKILTHFDTANLSVYVAPFLHSFEIQKDFCYDQITQKFGERFIEEKEGKFFFNFLEALMSLVPPQTVYDTRDTATDLSLPSNRRGHMKERLVTTVSFA